jgi:hypothetical protein
VESKRGKRELQTCCCKKPSPLFVTFRLKDIDKTTRQINPFYLQMTVDAVAVKFKMLQD